jgi:phospholipid transport system substrate-binding protein
MQSLVRRIGLISVMSLLVTRSFFILVCWASSVGAESSAPNIQELDVTKNGSSVKSPSAHETIQNVTTKLIATIETSRDTYKTNPDQFFKSVEDIMSPAIDFDKITRGVMGKKYYSEATPEQRARFITTFKNGLIQTYAKGLVEFNNHKIEVLPPNENVTGKNKVVVKQKIYGQDAIYPVSYSMGLSDDGKWRLFNVTINGINLGLTFKNQFVQYMKDYKGDIEKVISNWSVAVNTTAS